MLMTDQCASHMSHVAVGNHVLPTPRWSATKTRMAFHWRAWGRVRQLSTSGKIGHTFGNSGNQNEPSHPDFHYLLSYFLIQ